MGVPKAAAHLDDLPQAREDNVRSAGQVRAMKTKSKAKTMRDAADDLLRLGVHLPDQGHSTTAIDGGEKIHVPCLDPIVRVVKIRVALLEIRVCRTVNPVCRLGELLESRSHENSVPFVALRTFNHLRVQLQFA